MKHPQTADFRAILDVLLDARVEHIIIGGVAAILHGSPSTTRDLDVIHRREPENVARLLLALRDVKLKGQTK